MAGFRTRSGVKEVVALAASTTLTNEDLGKLFTNRGASGAVTITLPTPSSDNAGGHVQVRVVADQNVTVNCSTNGKIVLINDAAGNSVAWSTSSEKIGGGGLFESDGTNWFFIPQNAGANTVTTTT